MKSIIVITIKCLLFAGIITGGCMIAETIEFDLDFSGTKTIEFQYQEESENIFYKGDPSAIEEEHAESPFALIYIDSIFKSMEKVSNLSIDTSDVEFAKISYDFEAGGPKVKDQAKYDMYVDLLPDELKWYFLQRPNTFEVLNKNQLMWKAIDVDLYDMDLKSIVEFAEEMENVETITTLKFPRKIKKISADNISISADRKMLKARIDLEDVAKIKRANDVVITFE